jgi:hypothetical protein
MASALRLSSMPTIATALGAALIAVGPAESPPVSSTFSPNVQLTSGDELIMMSGTGSSTVTSAQETLVAGAINDRYGTDFGMSNTDALSTPEGTYSGTFQDGEIDLFNALSGDQGDNVTVFGVSQSGAIVGMAIQDIETGQFPTGESSVSEYSQLFGPTINPLPSDFSAADLPQNIHWVALAPASMPLHDNAGGEFSYPTTDNIADSTWTNVNIFPTNAGNADVYCGMYDPICDYPEYPTNPNAFYAYENSEYGGTSWVHGNYTNLTPEELDYEVDHATEFTINDPTTGAITIYPDQQDAPTDMTHFYLMPDVYNWGATDAAFGAPGSDYDSLLPALGSDITFDNQANYEEWLPYDTLEADAGYDDALHPFEYMIDNTYYTFYNDQVVPVADLPAGVSAPVVSITDFDGQMGTLATEIAYGIVSPTGTAEASTAATDLAADAATASSWWTELLASI